MFGANAASLVAVFLCLSMFLNRFSLDWPVVIFHHIQFNIFVIYST